jgi:hypothetical protein
MEKNGERIRIRHNTLGRNNPGSRGKVRISQKLSDRGSGINE